MAPHDERRPRTADCGQRRPPTHPRRPCPSPQQGHGHRRRQRRRDSGPADRRGGLADVVLVDIVEGLPQGKGLDLAEAAPVVGHDARVIGTNDYADTAGSDIVVVTSGLARQPGMSRDDLLAKNAGIVRAVVSEAAKHSPDAILIIVTNPLDAMCHVALQASGFPRERVLGMAGVLDSARFRTFIAQELGVSRSRTPTRSSSAATATRWSRCRATRRSPACRSPSCSRADRVKALEERTANGGAEVVALLKTGSAFYAPAASTFEMVESILLDRKRVLPCAVLLQGEFDTDGLFVGVPVVLGAAGLERVFEIELTADEQAAFERRRPRSRSSSTSSPEERAGRPGVSRRTEAFSDALHIAPIRLTDGLQR